MPRQLRAGDAAFVTLVTFLMLAPVVVASATAYVYVSGFASPPSSPARVIALNSASALDEGEKSYVIAAASHGMRFEDLVITFDGITLPYERATSCEAAPGSVVLCREGAALAPRETVRAGDLIVLAGLEEGGTLRILDADANSIILTLRVA